MKAIHFERSWPYAGALIILVAWWIYGRPFPVKPDPLMSASGTVAAVLIGFLGTAKAIVLGLTDSAVFKSLKTSGFSTILFAYLYEALTAGMVFLLVSMVGFFIPESPATMPEWFPPLWIATAAAAVLLYMRVTSLLFKLIKRA